MGITSGALGPRDPAHLQPLPELGRAETTNPRLTAEAHLEAASVENFPGNHDIGEQ